MLAETKNENGTITGEPFFYACGPIRDVECEIITINGPTSVDCYCSEDLCDPYKGYEAYRSEADKKLEEAVEAKPSSAEVNCLIGMLGIAAVFFHGMA